jgi:3-methyladenine DNA glycosylase AlkC
MLENFQIRDFFNRDTILQLADKIKSHYQSFDSNGFYKQLVPNIDAMTYSERKTAITDVLDKFLPVDFQKAIDILLHALPAPIHADGNIATAERFMVVPMAEFVARKGLDDVDVSLSALHRMTKSCTSEWAIRPFIEKHPDKLHKTLKIWARDKDEHVRRLVSEGSRPYVPWGQKLILVEQNPEWSITLLELLKHDPSEYVRRSVANHLNDLTKKHPERILTLLTAWNQQNDSSEMKALIKHALRNLIKQGHPVALELIGFSSTVDVEIRHFKYKELVEEEGIQTFSFDLVSKSIKEQDLLIDYAIHFQKSNGTISPKVFKLTSLTLMPGEIVKIKKSFSFKKITTRKYYFGLHKIEIFINGNSLKLQPFYYGLKE